MRSILACAATIAFLGLSGAAAMAAPQLPALSPIATKSDVQEASYRRGGRCVAVGKTINGRRIPGVRGVGHGRFACREAMRECSRDLARRKFSGRNPFGRCTVIG